MLAVVGLPLVGVGLGSRLGLGLAKGTASLLLCAAGLVLHGACLGCVATMLPEALLASMAATADADAAAGGGGGGAGGAASLLTVIDTCQSLGLVVGPLLGAYAVRHMETLTAALAFGSLLLLGPVATLRAAASSGAGAVRSRRPSRGGGAVREQGRAPLLQSLDGAESDAQ